MYLLSTDLGPVLFNTTEFGWPAKHSSNWMNESTFCTSEACLESDYADENYFFLIWHSAESDNWGVLDVAFHVSWDLNYKNTVKQMQQGCSIHHIKNGYSFCHPLLTFKLFQTFKSFFLMFNTKYDILKNQTVVGPHCLS